ncbi:ROK family protein [Aestuariimicrobium soli]|uniref:ROK family transcriptional regulator n=1 Tax=Aestuariimicrobium soli TaxID=2035834 RepID=UPI003EB7844A
MTPTTPIGGAPQRLMRQVNDRVFCELLAQHGPMSRPQLAKLAGLSSPATLKVIERLEAQGLVVSDGFDESSRPGPKAVVFALAPKLGLATAVELRGNSLRIAHSPLGSTAAERHDVPVETDDRLAELVVESVKATIPTDAYRHHTVAIALPGAIDPGTGDVLFSTELPRWAAGTAQRIRDELGPRSGVLFDNEVNFRAIAERLHGVAGQWEDYALLSLGSGVGAAVVLGGRVHRGRHGAAGEVGFMRTGGDSAAPFQDRAGAWTLANVVGRAHDREFAWLHEVVATEPLGSPVWDALAERIIPGLVNLSTILDPGLVILGGETARIAGEPLRAALDTSLRASLHWQPPTLLRSHLGDEAVLLGALDEARRALAETGFGSTS